jgi:hypothetical protein
MQLYCLCGYAILVTGHWTGETYRLELRDASAGTQGETIARCPQCCRPLAAQDLERLPPAEFHWLPEAPAPEAVP